MNASALGSNKIKPVTVEPGHTAIRIEGKYVQTEFTCALVTYKVIPNDPEDKRIDMTMFIVYDHRENPKLESIAKFLMGDILRDEKNLFFEII